MSVSIVKVIACLVCLLGIVVGANDIIQIEIDIIEEKLELLRLKRDLLSSLGE